MREKLAKLAHEQWSGWMVYLFSKCKATATGEMVIPRWAVDRWKKQSQTPYSKLSAKEQESDRKEADKFLALFTDEYERKVP